MSMFSEPTVFVVDDDADVCKSLAFLLESAGLKAKTYSSAHEFLAAYDNAAPGCLVLDVRLPGMSGLDLQERLKAQGATIPVIVITAYGNVPMAVRSLKAGALEFIQKPFSGEVLVARCEEAIKLDSRIRTRNQLSLLSPKARLVLGCIQLLDDISVERVAEASQLTATEVSHCIAELNAVYRPARY